MAKAPIRSIKPHTMDTKTESSESKPAAVMSKADSVLANALERQAGLNVEPSREELARITHENYTSMFKLPDECLKGDGLNYTWNWCESDERMLNIMLSSGHRIANSTNAPFLKRYINHACGAVTVQRANLHILMMRSKRYHEAEEEATVRKTIGRMKSNESRLANASNSHVEAVEKVSVSGGYGPDGIDSAPLSFDADGTETSLESWSS